MPARYSPSDQHQTGQGEQQRWTGTDRAQQTGLAMALASAPMTA
jgi:hypothetical protein